MVKSLLGRLVQKLTVLTLAAGIAFTPTKANSYATGDISNLSIHPLLVQKLAEKYQPPEGITFDLFGAKNGSINEDSPVNSYLRSINHFEHYLTHSGLHFSSSVSEWATNPSAQSSYPFGDHTWDRVQEDYNQGIVGEDFGYIFHLICDLTVPAHTRTDTHIWRDGYEYWTDKHKNEIMSDVKPNNIPQFDSLEELMGNLATHTGSNYFSDDTVSDGGINGISWVTEGNKIYGTKIIDGTLVKVLRKGIIRDFPDEACFKDIWKKQGTKAVEYGLAALNLLEGDQLNCIPKNYQECFNEDLWWFDSCGDRGTIAQYCDNGCSNGKCNCVPHYKTVCDDKGENVYWQDSCGYLEELLKSCDYGCSDGQCNDLTCSNECNYSSLNECFGNGWKECGNYDADNCLEWSGLNSCDNGCSDGECNGQSCSDKCDYSGQKECVGSGWKECGYVGDCLEWGGLNSCNGNETCESGECKVNVVEDKCDPKVGCGVHVSNSSAYSCGSYFPNDKNGCIWVNDPNWFSVCLLGCYTNNDCKTELGFSCESVSYETGPLENSKACLLKECSSNSECNNNLSCVSILSIKDIATYETAKYSGFNVCYLEECIKK